MEDDYIAIEYNNRPAGGFTIDVYNYAHSIDLYRGYMLHRSRRTFPASELLSPFYCLVTSRRATQPMSFQRKKFAKYRDQFRVKKDMPAAEAAHENDESLGLFPWKSRR